MKEKMKVPNLENVKEGDRLWDLFEQKWQVVEQVSLDGRYPIMLEDESTCTIHGVWDTAHGIARYYKNEFKFQPPDEAFTTPKRQTPPPKDTLVYFPASDTYGYSAGQYSDKTSNMLMVYANGTTSETYKAIEHASIWQTATEASVDEEPEQVDTNYESLKLSDIFDTTEIDKFIHYLEDQFLVRR